MRVIILNQFFYPDHSATSQLMTDLAQDLVHIAVVERQAGHLDEALGACREAVDKSAAPFTDAHALAETFAAQLLNAMVGNFPQYRTANLALSSCLLCPFRFSCQRSARTK